MSTVARRSSPGRIYLAVFLGIGMIRAYAGAQSVPGYSLPGGIRVLQEGRLDANNKPYEFPDNVEARKWLVGFDRGIVKVCPPTKTRRTK
ncbi:MAG: hypothetical protein JO108_09935 [Acidobacteriaceae bacterium]|nr:hypothetical protein [Acidobacteriaceae bacterium]